MRGKDIWIDSNPEDDRDLSETDDVGKLLKGAKTIIWPDNDRLLDWGLFVTAVVNILVSLSQPFLSDLAARNNYDELHRGIEATRFRQTHNDMEIYRLLPDEAREHISVNVLGEAVGNLLTITDELPDEGFAFYFSAETPEQYFNRYDQKKEVIEEQEKLIENNLDEGRSLIGWAQPSSMIVLAISSSIQVLYLSRRMLRSRGVRV